jgi:hypothetical protein
VGLLDVRMRGRHWRSPTKDDRTAIRLDVTRTQLYENSYLSPADTTKVESPAL